MLRAAILTDRINYTAGLMSEIVNISTTMTDKKEFSNFRRYVCHELYEQLKSLGVEPLTYEAIAEI